MDTGTEVNQGRMPLAIYLEGVPAERGWTAQHASMADAEADAAERTRQLTALGINGRYRTAENHLYKGTAVETGRESELVAQAAEAVAAAQAETRREGT